jgi:predicted transcriptional regulator
MKMEPISVAIEPETNDRLDNVASALRTKKSALVRAAIRAALPRWELSARDRAIELAADLDPLSRRQP